VDVDEWHGPLEGQIVGGAAKRRLRLVERKVDQPDQPRVPDRPDCP